MSDTTTLQESAIRQHGKALSLPTIGGQCASLAQQAKREHRTDLGYLDALLVAELEERERNTVSRRIREAHLSRLKTLEDFDFAQAPGVSPTRIQELAQGDDIARAEPVMFIGESGTGKTHLLTGRCVAACRQKRRVLGRWERDDLIALDEVGDVPLAEIGVEFLFQVVAERAERSAVILTTNLPFSEWTQVIPNPRLCKALLDRITDQAHRINLTACYRSSGILVATPGVRPD